MSADEQSQLVAVDVGNTSINLGLFDLTDKQQLPEPVSTTSLNAAEPNFSQLDSWITECNLSESVRWSVISVNQKGLDLLLRWCQSALQNNSIEVLQNSDFPLHMNLESPEKVGADRLAAAVAANKLRKKDHGVIIVDAGSAITVDLVDQQGQFQGGAILPGLKMSAASLAGQTDALPLIDVDPSHPPEVVGKQTSGAIRSGIYWGHVGAVEHLISKIKQQHDFPVDVLFSGGDAIKLAGQINHVTTTIQHLVLSGIAVTFFEKR